MTRDFTPPEQCPVCGEPVPRNARSCPGCGADERAGWDEAAAVYDGLDLPDTAFEDETAGANPAGARKTPKREKRWRVFATILVSVVMIFCLVRYFLPHG